jgi:hypothetical protein
MAAMLPLAVLLGTYVLCRYACDFTLWQSLLIVVLTSSVVNLYSRSTQLKHFQPFHIWLKPNYGLILRDAGVLDQGNDWGQLMQTPTRTVQEYLDDGVSLFALAYDPANQTHLVAWPDAKRFSSYFDYSIASIDVSILPAVSAYPSGCERGNGSVKARFRVRAGAGIEIVMIIDEAWWNNRWNTCPAPRFQSVTPLMGDVEIVVASIPFEELQSCYAWYPYGRVVSLDQRDKARGRLGWSEDFRPGSQIHGWGISHQYATVTHEAI